MQKKIEISKVNEKDVEKCNTDQNTTDSGPDLLSINEKDVMLDELSEPINDSTSLNINVISGNNSQETKNENDKLKTNEKKRKRIHKGSIQKFPKIPKKNENVSCNNSTDYNKLKEEYDVLRRKNAELKLDNAQLARKESNLRTKYKNSNAEVEKLRKLNYDLQVQIIDKAREKNDIVERIGCGTECTTFTIENNFPKIGFYRQSDQMVHIGQDRYLPEASYNRLMNQSDSCYSFVGGFLNLQFTLEDLVNSTVTGLKSNRNKRENIVLNKLDPSILSVGAGNNEFFQMKLLKHCQTNLSTFTALYTHWLLNYFTPKPTKKKKKVFNIDSEQQLFYHYVSKQLSYIKQCHGTKDTEPQDSYTVDILSNVQVNMEEQDLASKSNDSVGQESEDEENKENLSSGTDEADKLDDIRPSDTDDC